MLALAVQYGCATSPQQRIDASARQYGYERLEIQGAAFRHLIYRKNFNQGSDVLHVYLEGDGSPWAMRHIVSTDPTPRQPVMLQLMSYDKKPSLYLGRPCYHGLAESPGCGPAYWTMGRYSTVVVDSMVAALNRQMDEGHFESVMLFGHSGGGTLALLMAEKVRQTGVVVTLAGNLDVADWAEHHGYSPLSSSLDPANRPPLEARIRQYHFMGGKDRAIPPSLVVAWAQRQPNARVNVYERFDHTCCWNQMWPGFLNNLEN